MLPYIIAGTAGGLAATVGAIRYMFPWLKYDIDFIKKGAKVYKIEKNLTDNNKVTIDVFEDRVKEVPNKPFLIFEERIYTYDYVDRQANKVANLAKSLGVKRGQTVAILIPNSPEFIWTFFGLSKIGVKVAFLNYNLRDNSLLHCFEVSGAEVLIVGKGCELIDAVAGIQDRLCGITILLQGDVEKCPPGMIKWDQQFSAASDEAIPKNVRSGISLSDTLCYIYTSGTTGLPKPAIITHARFIRAGSLMLFGGFTSNDILYTTLPLYHSAAGMIGLGAIIHTGATMVIRQKFSTTHFWKDCKRHNVTTIQYIGELCRYLLSTPKSPEESQHKVRIAVGNGLRPDIWEEFKSRFNIAQILEFYGATEGTGGYFNIHNKTGSVGRSSPVMRRLFPAVFIKYDIENDKPFRNKKGFCELAQPDKPGLLVVAIKKNITEFDGYKGNKSDNEAKMLRNVFKRGDEYFNSGDLFTIDKEYFVYFSDRIGDTFRWKGENVSTYEVANVITKLPWIHDANVYGVKISGKEGRAGMAALTLTEGSHQLSLDQAGHLFDFCSKQLPRYAMPMFIRIQTDMELTSTFKQKKFELVKQGFDPCIISDHLYMLDSIKKEYVPLTMDLYKDIQCGISKL